MRVSLSVFLLAAISAVNCSAQVPNPTEQPVQPEPQQAMTNSDRVPLYKIQVVEREIPAVNYFNRKGSTKIGLRGTTLMPDAKGAARVQERDGRTAVDLDLEGLTPANGFGEEYLTYVLWAITPEGRPENLGEVLPTGDKNQVKITVTTNLQAFGLIITAEPYFDVSVPSDVVVAQNYVEKDTQGIIGAVNAHYMLLPRGAYAETAGRHEVLHPIGRNGHSPLELYEAENAVQIAQAAGADHYASDTFATAQTALQNAQDINEHNHHDRKMTITYARQAVQSAEDARIITIRKIKAEDEARAEDERKRAQEEAQQQKEAADQAAAQRAQAEAAAQEAQARAQQAAAQREAAEAQAEQARQQSEEAQKQAQLAAQQTEQMRERLRQQLSQVLQTRETARGLIVNMSDVLFAFNKYELKPDARVKLAKVSGILQAYPDLKLQVEGYTDSIGSDAYNQNLSEERANSVRDFLVSQGVQQGNITAQGYGKSDPIADNSTAEGRSQNRRVELVVSGNAIGVPNESQPGAQGEMQPAGQPGSGGPAPLQGQPGAAPPPPPNTSGTSNPPPQR